MDNLNTNKSGEAQINIVIGTLLEAASDKNDSVRLTIKKSLKRIAKKYPNEVLTTICNYVQKNPKLTLEHLITLFQPMEEICTENIVEIDGDTILLLINFSINEMTKSHDYIPNTQMCISSILVAIGKKHCIQVMEGILTKLVIGVVPHYTIPHTMGALASVNSFGVLPFLKTILGLMLPMLGMLKTDVMKQSFACAFGCFCEAINEYMSNIKSAPDPTIQKDMFSTEIGIAYDVLFTSWLHSREPKITEVVLQALGPMFSILTPEKITEHTPRLITSLLLMYRKYKDFYLISQCLASVLLDILTLNKALLDPHLDAILNTLHEVINPVPDYAQYEIVKNNSEILRCYDRVASCFCDKTVDVLIQLLKSHHDKDRIKALIIITHLINSSDSVVKNRIPDIVIALKPILVDPSLKVRVMLLKTIVAFAYHGHFLNSEGSIYVEFIVKLCCSSNTINSKGIQELSSTEWNEMIRTCDNSLYLITTTVLELENVLWCLFLDCLLNKHYSNACCILIRCLTCLAQRKKEKMKLESESINFTNSILIFSRCLALLASPYVANRGVQILNFLKNFSCHIHKHLPPLWDTHIPNLLNYLKDHGEENNHDWESHIFEFLALTIKDIDEEKWKQDLVQNILEQMCLYETNSSEKELSLKCFAITLCQISNSDFVKQKLDLVIDSFKFCNSFEAGIYAKTISICSRSHLELVLCKLNILRKEELLKKSNKFLHFNFMKDTKHEIEVEKLRYTLLLCYSELVLEVSSDKMLLNVEHEILNWVMQELQNTKDFQIKKICFMAIGNIAKAMHPSNNKLHIRLQSRKEVMSVMLGQLQLHSGPEYIELIPIILPVLTALVELRNELDTEQRIYLIKTCFDTVYNAASIYCKLTTTNSNGITYGDLKLAPFVYNSFEKLNALIRALLLQNISPAILDEILTLLEPWLSKKKPEQRLPAIENLKSVLSIYLVNMKFTYEVPSKFGQTGFLLGRIVPRCTDSYANIRLYALECVNLILCIAAKYEGCMLDHNNKISASIMCLKNDIETFDPKLLYTVTTNIAKCISDNLPQFQSMHFTESLLDGLLDVDSSSSSGSSVVLHTFFKLKGGELYNHVNDLLTKLLMNMSIMTCNKTRTSSIKAVFCMAEHHPKATAAVLLAQPLPYDKHVSDCWVILAQEPNLALDLLEQFKHVFNTIPFHEEQQNSEHAKVATVQPLAAVCALHDMFHNSKMQTIILAQLPELFAILLIIISSYIDVSPPIHIPQPSSKKDSRYSVIINRESLKLNPTKVALDTLRMCLLCGKLDNIADTLMKYNSIENSTLYLSLLELLPPVVDSIFVTAPHIVAKLSCALQPYTDSNLESQRVVTYGFFVEVLKHKGNGQPSLTENIIKTLLNGQTDTSEIVRLLVLRGLSYVSDLDNEQKAKHGGFIFSTLLQGLNDLEICNSDINIPLEALLGFSKMLHSVDEKQLESVQISAAVRIKAFFEKDDPLLRAAAFRLLGDLSRSFEKCARLEAFREQVNGNFICLLLHLTDDNEDVVKACKYALRQVTPILEATNVNKMIRDHLIEDANLQYSEFISDLVKIMVQELNELFPFFILNALVFVKSQWSIIRGNAALITGLLYNNLVIHCGPSQDIQLDTICYRLMQLLQDEDGEVKAKAVQSLSYLFDS